jgi:hypothetical protein
MEISTYRVAPWRIIVKGAQVYAELFKGEKEVTVVSKEVELSSTHVFLLLGVLACFGLFDN